MKTRVHSRVRLVGALPIVALSYIASGQAIVSWGSNGYGQATVPAGSVFSVVAGGNLHSVGLKLDGTVQCWGANQHGQSVAPTGLSNVVAVAAGGWYGATDTRGHSAALLSDGTVRCWGNNQFGQINVPPDLSNVVQIACGWAHTVALRSDRSVRVWGAGSNQGADPNWGQALVPADLGVVDSIATRGCHIMARRNDGSVRCWGRNQEGQSSVPAGLVSTHISAGSDHSMAIDASKAVRCWGWNYLGQCNVPPGLGPTERIAATTYGSVALLLDGTIRTWGLVDAPASKIPCISGIFGGGYHVLARTESSCPRCSDADLNDDQFVDGSDLGTLLSRWGPSANPDVADLNRDGVVDGEDLGIVLNFWGPCP